MNYLCKILQTMLITSLIGVISIFLGVPKQMEASTVKGIWLSYIDFKDAGLYDKSEEDFIANAERVFSTLDRYGFNTMYLQVRPYDDAIYPSEIFSWCTYLSPKPLRYDPLEIMIEKAQKYDIAIHAWINPYRITSTKIYDPSKNSTTKHIVDGVIEILENYEVDGIHIDDYFYPAKKKGEQFYKVSINNRKKNVNKMLKTLYSAIKDFDESIEFGISPAGNIEYAESIGCDFETWCANEGYVDYIIPQIYWSDDYRLNGKKTKLYTDKLREWTELVDGRVPMYIGLALYKSGIKSSIDRGWKKSSKNIITQVSKASSANTDGYVMFSYKYLFTGSGKKETSSYIKSISKLKLDVKSITLKKNKKYDLVKRVSVNKSFKTSFKFTSTNKSVATVSSAGIVQGKRAGTTRIYVTGIGGSKVSCQLRVRS